MINHVISLKYFLPMVISLKTTNISQPHFFLAVLHVFFAQISYFQDYQDYQDLSVDSTVTDGHRQGEKA